MAKKDTRTGIVTWGALGTIPPKAFAEFKCNCGKTSIFTQLLAACKTSFGTTTYHCPQCSKVLAAHIDPRKWEW
jgi:predicted RNA-binding Zn-ribbon protein involved in translation (DUF1610 family)